MHFEAKAVNTFNLMSSVETGFLVPAFQRRYTWGREDIRRLFGSILLGIESDINDIDYGPFLGACILVESHENAETSGVLPKVLLQIIDGQQRLTTILLIACELRARLQNFLSDLQSENLKQLVENRIVLLTEFLTVQVRDNRGREEVPALIRAGDKWGHGAAQCEMESPIGKYLLHRGIIEENYTSDDPTLHEAVNEVVSCLTFVSDGFEDFRDFNEYMDWAKDDCKRHLLGPDGSGFSLSPEVVDQNLACIKLLAFARYLIWDVRLVQAKTKEIHGALSLFGPLNSTGQNLTAVELLKPNYVADLGNRFLASPEAQAFTEIFEYLDMESPTDTMSRTQDFVTGVALAESGEKIGGDLDLQRVYLDRRFRAHSVGDERLAFLQGINAHANFLKTAWFAENPPRRFHRDQAASVCFELLRPAHVIVAPIISRYWSFSDEEVAKVVKAIAAFSTLWRLAKEGTSGIDSKYRSLLESGMTDVIDSICRRADLASTATRPAPAENLQRALRKLLEENCAENQAAWVEKTWRKNAYRSVARFTRFALLASFHDSVEDTTQGSEGLLKPGAVGCGPTLTLDLWESLDTVEHIAPQNRNGVDYENAIYADNLQHTIGNLALLPMKLNTIIGNRPWSDKRDMFKVLGNSDQDEREQQVRDFGFNLRKKKKQDLADASCIKGVNVLASNSDCEFKSEFVTGRSKRICELVYQRLISWL
jgi:uncharacterized protein DUF262/uncharacterized protein DUF1524